MTKIVNSIVDLVGNTPLVKLNRVVPEDAADVYVKLEFLNPAGSIKDRIALAMIEGAEKAGKLQAGGTIVEPTSGNTGVGLAMVAAAKGYHLVITMPETMSVERRMLLSAYGAELVLTPGDEGMAGAVKRADEIISATPGAVLAGQFDNPANPAAHERTTGPELWSDLGGRLAAVVAGVGTGGTITGTARYLKRQNPAIRFIAVEPAASPLLSQGHAGPHGIMGIGANFVPKALDRSLLDDIYTVADEDAYAMARKMARLEGVLVGISSGAALAAAERAAKETDGAVAVILPDGGERYLSTGLFEG